MAASVKRDTVKQKWEETEFPLVCENCMGDNPYIRMTKEAYGKQCKICENPFMVFSWQAGSRGRLKRVEICRTCAQAKNVCQVCIYDLQYGLPVQVRDKVLRESGSGAAVLTVAQSNANRAWHNAQRERAVAQGQAGYVPNEMAAAKLHSMARMEPRYERNAAKLCSFFARGECNRGTECPFRHELPKDKNDPLNKQNTKDRYYGTHDPVAKKMMTQLEQREAKEAAEGRSETTLFVRYADKSLSSQQQQQQQQGQKFTEMDIRDAFYSYGEIVSVRIVDKQTSAPSSWSSSSSAASYSCCFVEYSQPEVAELAMNSMNRQFFKGKQILVSRAHSSKRGEGGEAAERNGGGGGGVGVGTTSSAAATIIEPMAPPMGNVKPTSVVGPANTATAATATTRLPKGLAPATNIMVKPGGGRGGGGPIRGAGLAAARRVSSAPQPYYPSADPGRLGTNDNSNNK